MKKIERIQISQSELSRRWKSIREALGKKGIDCLVMQNTNQYLGGYVRYFTDIPAATYGLSVVFPLNDEMTIVTHGGPPDFPPDRKIFGVKKRVILPYIQTLNFTNTMDANAIVETLKEQKVKAVGFVSKASMSASFYEYIRQKLPETEFYDATDLVDEIKTVKSDEEIELIKKAIELHDKVFEATLPLIRPGVGEYEVSSEIQRLTINMGSEYGQNMVGSAPPGTPARQLPRLMQNRELKQGDQVCIMIEVNGPGGFYGEIGRTVCIGTAPRSLLDVWRDGVEVQDRNAELMKPGANPSELFAMHNKLLSNMKYPIEGRIHSHGQGYDMVERPGIRTEETMKIQTGMHMAIHPLMLTKEALAFCCDNYLVTKSRAVRLSKTAREIFVV
ncbi:MAG: M24 family metallopeptidase [Candidatus Bathyarchaeota archaeon]